MDSRPTTTRPSRAEPDRTGASRRAGQIPFNDHAGYDRPVIAVIFHFWLGLLLVLSGGLVVLALVGGYVKSVTAAKYPNGKQKRED